jgi:hypothetical protein
MIDACSFGKMVVEGREYSRDLILFPDRVLSPWWRDKGHRLTLKDLAGVPDAAPQILIIGTGFMGLMKVSGEVKKFSEERGIELFIEKTAAAVVRYNRLAAAHATVGAFHLTC